MEKKNDKVAVAVNERKCRLETRYNEEYCESVNKVLAELREGLHGLTDGQIRFFLKDPAALSEELTAEARKAYDSYVRDLPEGVRASMAFKCSAADIVARLHSKLPLRNPLQQTHETEIKGGECVLTDEGRRRIREACSVYGDAHLQEVWGKAVEAAKALTELSLLVKGNKAGVNAVEVPGRWLGLLQLEADGTFSADVERLKLLC